MKKKEIWILLFCIVWIQCFGFSINFCQCYGIHLGDFFCCSDKNEKHNDCVYQHNQSGCEEEISQFTIWLCFDIQLADFQFLGTAKSKLVLSHNNFFGIIFHQFFTPFYYQTPPNHSSCYNIHPLLQSSILLI